MNPQMLKAGQKYLLVGPNAIAAGNGRQTVKYSGEHKSSWNNKIFFYVFDPQGMGDSTFHAFGPQMSPLWLLPSEVESHLYPYSPHLWKYVKLFSFDHEH